MCCMKISWFGIGLITKWCETIKFESYRSTTATQPAASSNFKNCLRVRINLFSLLFSFSICAGLITFKLVTRDAMRSLDICDEVNLIMISKITVNQFTSETCRSIVCNTQTKYLLTFNVHRKWEKNVAVKDDDDDKVEKWKWICEFFNQGSICVRHRSMRDESEKWNDKIFCRLCSGLMILRLKFANSMMIVIGEVHEHSLKHLRHLNF